MRAAPAFQVSLQRFGWWRAAVLTLGVLGAAAFVTGWWSREASHGICTSIVVAVGAVAILGGSVGLARVRARSLRWDGQGWHLGATGAVADDAAPGELSVMIDLGPWMLLRFDPDIGAAHPRAVWLPAQRSGLEAQWHALRCAVYSPRPRPGGDSAAGP